MSEQIEWAIDYQDTCGPRVAPSESAARQWVTHWNNHREGQEAAVLVSRKVITTEWTPELLARGEDRLRESVSGGEAHPCGHESRTSGCGGCDPAAIEFIRDDGGPWVRLTSPTNDSPRERAAETNEEGLA